MTKQVERTYDGDGFRRILPSDRHSGLTELRLPDGRCFQAVAYGPEVDAALVERAKAAA